MNLEIVATHCNDFAIKLKSHDKKTPEKRKLNFNYTGVSYLSPLILVGINVLGRKLV